MRIDFYFNLNFDETHYVIPMNNNDVRNISCEEDPTSFKKWVVRLVYNT